MKERSAHFCDLERAFCVFASTFKRRENIIAAGLFQRCGRRLGQPAVAVFAGFLTWSKKPNPAFPAAWLKGRGQARRANQGARR